MRSKSDPVNTAKRLVRKTKAKLSSTSKPLEHGFPMQLIQRLDLCKNGKPRLCWNYRGCLHQNRDSFHLSLMEITHLIIDRVRSRLKEFISLSVRVKRIYSSLMYLTNWINSGLGGEAEQIKSIQSAWLTLIQASRIKLIQTGRVAELIQALWI